MSDIIDTLYDFADDYEAEVLTELRRKAGFLVPCPNDGWDISPDDCCGHCGMTFTQAQEASNEVL